MNPQQVAQLVKSEINKAISGLANRSVYRAEVVAVAGSRVNVIMEHAAGVHPNILCMSGYQPVVGDQVLILNIGLSGSNFIVIGRTNPEGVSGAPIGEIQMTLKNGADPGFILMTGGTFTKAAYPKLWDVVNANPGYGTTDSGTFTLKDMRQRMPFGKTASGSFSMIGDVGGATEHTLTIAQLPNRTGRIEMHSNTARTNVTSATGQVFSEIQAQSGYRDGGLGGSESRSIGGINFNLGGGGQAHPIMNPYIIVNYQVRAR